MDRLLLLEPHDPAARPPSRSHGRRRGLRAGDEPHPVADQNRVEGVGDAHDRRFPVERLDTARSGRQQQGPQCLAGQRVVDAALEPEELHHVARFQRTPFHDARYVHDVELRLAAVGDQRLARGAEHRLGLMPARRIDHLPHRQQEPGLEQSLLRWRGLRADRARARQDQDGGESRAERPDTGQCSGNPHRAHPPWLRTADRRRSRFRETRTRLRSRRRPAPSAAERPGASRRPTGSPA